MRTERFFIDPSWIAPQSLAFTLPAGTLTKQITLVLRMRVGDTISLLPNDGKEYVGTITHTERGTVSGIITGVLEVQRPKRPVTLCAAITKRDTFEWTLQKCTELGVQTFIPLVTDRTIKKPSEVSHRWHDIIREAAEQSGQGKIPDILSPQTFTQALRTTAPLARIMLHESAEERALPVLASNLPVGLFIGPEGGFSDDEVRAALAQNITLYRMGTSVLRAETAAIVGSSLFLLEHGK